jgi:hypothetical protein
MAEEGAIECLILLLDSTNDLIQRQSAKALANLGVNADNKPKIADAGGIPKLIRLAGTPQISVRIEAIAALANLAVNGQCDCLLQVDMTDFSHHRFRQQRIGDRAMQWSGPSSAGGGPRGGQSGTPGRQKRQGDRPVGGARHTVCAGTAKPVRES